MTVSITYDNSPGVEKWVVNKKGGGGFLGMAVDEQSTHNTQKAAKRAARRMADSGEKIVLNRKSGGKKVIRSGR